MRVLVMNCGSSTFTVDNSIATPTSTPTPTPKPTPKASHDLLLSLSSDRSDPVALAGRTVSGDIFVFSSPDDSAIDRVRFYLNDPHMSGTPYQVERNAAYDFAGGSKSTANPFHTTDVADGDHTITAQIVFSDGSTAVVSSTFTVDNGS